MIKINRIYDESIEDDVFNFLNNDDIEMEEEFLNFNSYDYFYCLSHLRENLFAWYPFKEDSSLLEIGGDYGQLTNLFCQKLNKVVSVEISSKRAEIIKTRCNADNLEVLVNDFSDIQTDEKFDYIVLCNVFEYFKSYNNSLTPFKDYLRYLKTLLKNDGVILIAISNRLGLKYFAGYKEEHVNQYFTGIDEFTGFDNVQTFSRNEFENLLESADFTNYKFFYPYPDHYFPNVISTDEFANKIPYERAPIFVKERANFFRENLVNQVFSQNGISQYFSNSFLIEIRNNDNPIKTDKINYVKINADRKEQFRTLTYILSEDDETNVIKKPLNSSSQNHLSEMHERSNNDFGKIKFLENSFDGESFKYEFLEEESFEYVLIDAIIKNDKIKFFKLLEKYFYALFYNSFISDEYCSDEFLEIFEIESNIEFHCHEFTNLDVIFSNVFVIDDEFVSIDFEWLFDFPVPLEYIFYRVIHHHHVTNPLFRNFVNLDEIFIFFDLDVENFKLFNQWESKFGQYVFGTGLAPETKFISKDNINNYFDKLLYDTKINVLEEYENENKELKETIKKQKDYIKLLEDSDSHKKGFKFW